MDKLNEEIKKVLKFNVEKYVNDYVNIKKSDYKIDDFYNEVEEDIYDYLICCLENYDYDEWGR